MSYTYQFKYIIIGDAGVGKSCIMLNFIDKRFRQEHDLTIGVEFGSKMIDSDGTKVNLQIWDTAGSESFKSITRAYYRSAAGAFLVFDITRRDSFQHIAEWLEEARFNGNPNMTMMLVGNKLDLQDSRVVSFEEAAIFARENGLLYKETSAKTGEGVNEVFEELTRTICKRIEDGSVDVGNQGGIVIKGKPKAQENKKCCG